MKTLLRGGILSACLGVALCSLAVAQKSALAKSKTSALAAKTPLSKSINLANTPRTSNRVITLDQILVRSYHLKPNQTVRVLLKEGISSAKIYHAGSVYVYALDENTRKYKFEGSGELSATIQKGRIKVGQISSAKAIVIDPRYGVSLTFRGREYKGVLVLIPHKGTMQVVEHTDLEEYLLGVVGYEMSPSWPLESLKAQAITARTFARIKMQDKSPTYDLKNIPSDQVYLGVADVSDSVKQAVRQTRGQVLMYNNELLISFYHASCGGHTRDGKVLLGKTAPRPLKGVSCSTCSKSMGHGVGMCQEGAKGLAEKKYSYRAILNHYFPGAKISTM